MSYFAKRGIFYRETAMEIRLKNLSKTYERAVLSGLDYTFESGKLYVIKGVSGCGKTTLFNVIGGIDPEYEGEVILPKKCRTAYIFQQSLLLSSLTVRENLLLICPDHKKVESLSETLGIHDLLDRMPDSLSGGERQRAAIVRALLTDPDVLLADEPTASLDGKNAEAVARMIAGLRTQRRVILVATHDAYFDLYADEIIELDYGTLGTITKNEYTEKPDREETDCTSHEEKTESGKPFCAELKYVWKKSRRFLKVKNLLLSAIFFFLILIAASVQNNISSETVRIMSRNKPINLLRIEQDQMRFFTEEDLKKMTFFDDYYAAEGVRTAYYLLPKEYSVLNIDGVLSYGTFPETEDGILVNETLAKDLAGNASVESVIGKELSFCGLMLKVSGVVGTYMGDFRRDYYYAYGKDGKPFDFHDKHLFIPYATLKTIGTKFERQVHMAIWPGLFEDLEARERLTAAGFSFNQYYLDAMSVEYTATMVSVILYGVLIVLFLIACLYSTSIIRLELFYRRKELGYLQIFGVPKKRVRRWIDLEYGMKLVGSFVLALAVYVVVLAGYAIVTGTFARPKVWPVLAMISVLCLLHYLTVRWTSGRFIKQGIIRLIRQE